MFTERLKMRGILVVLYRLQFRVDIITGIRQIWHTNTDHILLYKGNKNQKNGRRNYNTVPSIKNKITGLRFF